MLIPHCNPGQFRTLLEATPAVSVLVALDRATRAGEALAHRPAPLVTAAAEDWEVWLAELLGSKQNRLAPAALRPRPQRLPLRVSVGLIARGWKVLHAQLFGEALHKRSIKRVDAVLKSGRASGRSEAHLWADAAALLVAELGGSKAELQALDTLTGAPEPVVTRPVYWELDRRAGSSRRLPEWPTEFCGTREHLIATWLLDHHLVGAFGSEPHFASVAWFYWPGLAVGPCRDRHCPVEQLLELLREQDPDEDRPGLKLVKRLLGQSRDPGRGAPWAPARALGALAVTQMSTIHEKYGRWKTGALTPTEKNTLERWLRTSPPSHEAVARQVARELGLQGRKA